MIVDPSGLSRLTGVRDGWNFVEQKSIEDVRAADGWFDVPTTATSWGSNERLLLLWPIKVDIRLLLIKGWDI